jgi:hypothetical protein
MRRPSIGAASWTFEYAASLCDSAATLISAPDAPPWKATAVRRDNISNERSRARSEQTDAHVEAIRRMQAHRTLARHCHRIDDEVVFRDRNDFSGDVRYGIRFRR